MIRGLLVSAGPLAALLLSAAPAGAERWSDASFGAAANVTVHRGGGGDRSFGQFTARQRGGRDFDCERRGGRDFRRDRDGRGRDRDRDRDRFDRDCFFGGGSLGYLDYGDYDANRSFDPDLWNDWWHERPRRAYPRWVWRNQGCDESRMWSSGAGWRCTP